MMVLGTIRERLLFPEALTLPSPVPDALLVEELTRAYCAYLGAD